MLCIDGKQIYQTYAIMRYLGRIYDYYPQNPEDACKVDTIVEYTIDYKEGRNS